MKYHLHPNLDFRKLVSKKLLVGSWLALSQVRKNMSFLLQSLPALGPSSRLSDTQVPELLNRGNQLLTSSQSLTAPLSESSFFKSPWENCYDKLTNSSEPGSICLFTILGSFPRIFSSLALSKNL